MTNITPTFWDKAWVRFMYSLSLFVLFLMSAIGVTAVYKSHNIVGLGSGIGLIIIPIIMFFCLCKMHPEWIKTFRTGILPEQGGIQ